MPYNFTDTRVILIKLSKFGKITTSGAASDGNSVEIKIFLFLRYTTLQKEIARMTKGC